MLIAGDEKLIPKWSTKVALSVVTNFISVACVVLGIWPF